MNKDQKIRFKIAGVLLFCCILCILGLIAYFYMSTDRSSASSIQDLTDLSADTKTDETISDQTPPQTILVSSADTIHTTESITFLWSGTDDTTPASEILFSYRLDPEMDAWSIWEHGTSVVFSDLQPGLYLFQIHAQDSFGNKEQTSVQHSFMVVAQQEPNHNTSENHSYYYSWSAQKKVVTLDDSFFVSKKTPWEKTLNIDDKNIINLTIVLFWEDDFASSFFRFSQDVLTLRVFSSHSSCVFSQSSQGAGMIVFSAGNITRKPENGILYSSSYQEAVGMLSGLNHEAWVNDPITLGVSCRVRDIRPFIRLFREKGNSFSLNISYTFYSAQIAEQDTTPPETSILQSPKTVTSKRTVDFIWEGNDDFTVSSELVFQYRLDGYDAGWSSWSKETSIQYFDLPFGSYFFSVHCKDTAGNIDASPAVHSFTIISESTQDTTPPETLLLSGPEGVVQSSTVSFSWIGTDDQTAQDDLVYSFILRNYSSAWSSWSSSTSVTFSDVPDGLYLFEVSSRDRAGNSDPTPAKRGFHIQHISLNRFASQIIEFQPGLYGSSTAAKILGGPRGQGGTAGSTDVVVLGLKGRITLGFDVIITDKPGYDFIVFENPFFVGGSAFVFAELVHVEVSSDGVNFARFPGVSTTLQPVPAYMGILPDNCTNFAGVKPVYANVDENTLDPFDPAVAGGDSFDLAVLSSHPLVQSGLVDIGHICFIRLIDVQGDGTEYDVLGNPIYDATGGGMNGADIDAVAIVNYS